VRIIYPAPRQTWAAGIAVIVAVALSAASAPAAAGVLPSGAGLPAVGGHVSGGPLRPLQARSQITTYFNRIYFGLIDAGTMKVQTEALTAGRLVITGACSPTYPGLLRIDDSEAQGQTVVDCQIYHGHHVKSHTPRSLMPLTTEEHITYAPLIVSVGERAATSVGLDDATHGAATYAFDSATELDVTYAPNPAATTRQLKQLRLHVQNGHESAREVWYTGSNAKAAANAPHPIIPASTIIPIDSYYGTMLGPTGVSPYRVEQVALSAHQLVRAGACVYNSSGVRLGLVERTVDRPKGELQVDCPQMRGDRATTEFIPRSKLISNPSMDFQPLLEQLGTQAASSVQLPVNSSGTPLRVTINLNPKRHSGEADVFYSRSQPSAAGTKQVKELKFLTTRRHRETVRKVWY
jgi:hypothetical protein